MLEMNVESHHQGVLRNQFRIETTETGTETSFGTIRNKMFCFGCFALISKQGVSVFRNNRNKQKTNRNSSKFVKISTFLIPHTISSVCFSCFYTGPKHRIKPKNFFGGVSRKSKPKNNRNRLSFGLFRFEPRKKINHFEDPLIENVFWRFFRFVFVCLE